MTSPDLTDANITKLAELFPTVVTETVDEEGNPKRAVDFDLLRQELSDHVVEGPQERYQLDWPDKRAAAFAANAPIAKTLRPVREESVDFDTTQNLFIEGDNLEALKLLQESYLGKVKLIYIDPPYNTGNDFIYQDDFAESSEEYLARSGQRSDSGERLVANPESHGRFHSDWLSMMYPRLKLARNLLKSDGVMFISIGQNEVQNLACLCEEIFGRENVLGIIPREQKTGSNQGDFFAPQLDFIVAVARDKWSLEKFVVENRELAREDEKSLYQASLDPLRGCINQRYWIEAPDGSFIIPPGEVFPNELKDGNSVRPVSRSDRVWRWSFARYLAERHTLRFKKSGRGALIDESGNPSPWNVYTVKSNLDSEMRPRDYIFGLTNSIGTKELEILGLARWFDNPKPTELIRYLMEIVNLSAEDIVLDFFAGSGTTAQAVYDLNAVDGGNRRFILVQLREQLSADAEALRHGHDNLASVCRERITRAGERAREAARNNAVSQFDGGFRSLQVDTTNLVDLELSADDLLQTALSNAIDSVKSDRTGEDLLFQVLLDWGIDLAEPISVDNVSDCRVLSVANGALVACFADEVTDDVVREIANRHPLRAVFKDSGFVNDSARINAEQVFREMSPETQVRTI